MKTMGQISYLFIILALFKLCFNVEVLCVQNIRTVQIIKINKSMVSKFFNFVCGPYAALFSIRPKKQNQRFL